MHRFPLLVLEVGGGVMHRSPLLVLEVGGGIVCLPQRLSAYSGVKAKVEMSPSRANVNVTLAGITRRKLQSRPDKIPRVRELDLSRISKSILRVVFHNDVRDVAVFLQGARCTCGGLFIYLFIVGL